VSSTPLNFTAADALALLPDPFASDRNSYSNAESKEGVGSALPPNFYDKGPLAFGSKSVSKTSTSISHLDEFSVEDECNMMGFSVTVDNGENSMSMSRDDHEVEI